MNRRDFFRIAPFFFTSSNLAFSDLRHSNVSKNENSVIYLFLSGGMTHIESFNANPLAPIDYRSTTGSIKTKTPDLYFGGLLPKLASISNEFTIVHSYGHKDNNHSSAQHLALTGDKVIGDNPQFGASYGGMVSGIYGVNTPTGLPSYIKLNSHKHTDGGWLGSKYSGYDRSPDGLGDLSIKLSKDRFSQRVRTINLVESFSPVGGLGQEYTEIRNQAIDVLLGSASKAFMIEDDPEYIAYKGSRFAQDCLSAIRLVEHGARFIFLSNGGWDHHNDIAQNLKQKHAELDLYLSQLILSLKKRCSNTLLVVTTEFGRTPKVNSTAGRDHSAPICPLLLSSPNFSGTLVGKTNPEASEITENPFSPIDLGYTILHHMGIEKGTVWTSTENRPMPFINDKAKLIG